MDLEKREDENNIVLYKNCLICPNNQFHSRAVNNGCMSIGRQKEWEGVVPDNRMIGVTEITLPF